MRRALLLLPLLAAQALSVERQSEIGIWRYLVAQSEVRLEEAKARGDNPTLEGLVSFLGEAHTRLAVEYGQIGDLIALNNMYLEWREASPVLIARLGIGDDGRLEGNLSRLSLPHDDLLGGKYESWLLNVANLTEEVIPPEGWEVRLHLLDGTVITPASPADPALAGTIAAARPGRHLWRENLFPDTNTRVILLLPPVEEEQIAALEFSLGGSTVWIPWWENIL